MKYPESETCRRNTLIFNVLKVLLAGGLLFWLVKSGGIRPEYLTVTPGHIPGVIAACAFVAVGMGLAAFRYVELLKGAGLVISLKNSFRVSMIMYFFTQCVLGTASGDVARYYYTTGLTGQGAKVGAAIVVDRIIGIMGLLMLSGLGMALNWTLIENSPELRIIAVPALGMLCLIWLGVLLGFAALARGRFFGFTAGLAFVALAGLLCAAGHSFLSEEVGRILLYAALLALVGPLAVPEFLETGFIYRKFFKGSKLGEKIGEVVSALLIYRNSSSVVLRIVILTGLQHLVFILSLYLFSQVQNIPQLPDFNEIFFVAPLAFLAGIIPAPAAGLGVNEAAFESLLLLASSRTVAAGASIFLIYRIWTTLFSLSGLFFIGNQKKIEPNLEK
ncbi:lysylphosphatidylglycerol synthase transmembrane domain-containing protein [Maridesulfovibrio sp.]|uniref:lysylphosphatidylglycerol synthase transmembrane domain-containing protein n=1 Tax=Maridesulfovibrio sp. TaxID=2795000 RepID=UPI0029CA6DD7|nr:lysylphosphatidylglycerol synthase transmembrane domain-containing protein [Maridesulfovibrio sp.]